MSGRCCRGAAGEPGAAGEQDGGDGEAVANDAAHDGEAGVQRRGDRRPGDGILAVGIIDAAAHAGEPDGAMAGRERVHARRVGSGCGARSGGVVQEHCVVGAIRHGHKGHGRPRGADLGGQVAAQRLQGTANQASRGSAGKAEEGDGYTGVVCGRVEQLLANSHVAAGPVHAILGSAQRGGVVLARNDMSIWVGHLSSRDTSEDN
jgi:hypothetical protein